MAINESSASSFRQMAGLALICVVQARKRNLHTLKINPRFQRFASERSALSLGPTQRLSSVKVAIFIDTFFTMFMVHGDNVRM